MSNMKYLSDGRKVTIIGQLNNTQYIVQEIFMTDDGDEIPSGEKFTTSNLLEVPAKSYKEKEADRLNAHAVSIKSDIERLNKELRIMQEKRKANAELAKQSLKSIEGLESFDFSLMADIVAGNVRWVLEIGVNGDLICEPKLFEDALVYMENSYGGGIRFDGIKLLSVLGRSDGEISFRLNRYSDGSGSSTNVKFFKTDNDLREHLSTTLMHHHEKDSVSKTHIEICSKFIDVPSEVKEKVSKRIESKITETFERQKATMIEKYQKDINEAKALND